MHYAHLLRRRQASDNHRRSAGGVGRGEGTEPGRCTHDAPPCPASMDRRAGPAMRLLPERNDDRRGGTPCQDPQSDCVADQGRIHEQAPLPASVPLWHLRRNHRRRPARRQGHEGIKGTNAMTRKTQSAGDSPITATITRRGFVKIGGTLFVSLAFPAGLSIRAAESQNSLDPTLLTSWLEIQSDNTILDRTARTETGTGMSAYYVQA